MRTLAFGRVPEIIASGLATSYKPLSRGLKNRAFFKDVPRSKTVLCLKSFASAACTTRRTCRPMLTPPGGLEDVPGATVFVEHTPGDTNSLATRKTSCSLVALEALKPLSG